MGYFFEFDAENKVARISWYGQLTDKFLLEGYSAAGRALALLPPCRGINDMSGVTSFDVSSDVVQRLAESQPVFESGTMVVIVAPKAVVFGMSRMFAMLGERTRPNLHVVRTMEEAYSSLGIDSPKFSRFSAK